MMSDFLLGIDIGTGGAKTCLITTQGDVLSYAFEELALYHPQPSWSEHDAHQYWPIICRLIQQTLKQANASAHDVKGSAVSSALPSMVLVDANNNPVHNAYNLMDKRAVAQVDWLKKNIGEERLFQLSGYRLEDHPLLVNLLWEKQNRADAFKTITKVLTIDGYITLKLTGVAATHYSAAAF